jgi:methylphosphotriester-DNA--protein-cysteine methyltransferase
MIKPTLKKGISNALGLVAFFVFSMTFFTVNVHAQNTAGLAQQVANADRDLADQFQAEAEIEVQEVRSNPDLSQEEKTVREKFLRAAVQNVRVGFEIEESFDVAYNQMISKVNSFAPGLDLKSIMQEYKNQFS